MKKTRLFPPMKPHPELDKLLEESKKLPPLTEQQKQEQAKSWARQDMD